MPRRRKLALPLLAAALAIPLAACGGSKSAATSSSSTGSSKPASLTVLAAASLTDVFNAEGKAYEKAHPGTTIKFSYAGSQELAAQVGQGAPADVLVTADTKTMDGLKSDTRTPTIIAKNRLTIVTAPGNPKKITSLADLAKPGLKVDLAAPQVPVGNYGAKVLQEQHLNVKPVSLETNVRAVLTKVELGEADAGIVYITDAESAKGKVATVTIPDAQNAIASYPAATLNTSKDASAAASFVAFLSSAQGQQILRSYGFQQP
ncbi:molybdate ABC transporter substrate-binding protein [Streptomyces sp. RB6PN25]|uniref:Molybdate ABC transporter substrate-binding protein n=1 Tax=Streptomyces humicola TaxID=2953240 RepID=A0ABT1PRF3_9ACTN|nr:molybdate ABC transporter substrate-binding protein [Streptomyces humicola]MCQ4080244.1 molybdate ABC transporter substrate-binding protein [Streptomyces humicola]